MTINNRETQQKILVTPEKLTEGIFYLIVT